METSGEEGPGGATGRLHHVFGPVVSRRLGRSLGVDPVPPKTCNWNCVYCQLGRTRPFRTRRREYVPTAGLLQEVEAALAAHPAGSIDWVTFVGSGETLLHADLGRMLRRVKELTDLPIAVITNGSLLFDPAVRWELLHADAVLPSLDAGSPELFRRINRPHPGIPFHRHFAGLEAFRQEYRGRLLVEVMLVQGLNDTEEALAELASILGRITPDGIHLSRPDRPPAEPWVSPTDEEGYLRANAILGPAADVLHPLEEALLLDCTPRALDTVLAVLGRHPLSQGQIRRALARWAPEEATRFLASLESCPEVKKVVRHGKAFWVSRGATFPSPPKAYS